MDRPDDELTFDLPDGRRLTCPLEIDEAKVIAWAVVDDGVEATGNAMHRLGGDILGPAAKLAICRYKCEGSYSLFYCDSDWTVLVDTWHLCIEDAKSQAEFEYQGISSRWHMSS